MNKGKKQSIAFKELCMLNIIQEALSGIKKEGDEPYTWEDPCIRAFLHKIVLSGKRDTCMGYFKKLTDMFGPFYQDNDFKPKHRMPNYLKKSVRNLKHFVILLFTDPINYMPPYRIEIVPRGDTSPRRYKALLERIISSVGDIHVTSIEYTVDIYCHDVESVERFSRTLLRYLYIRYARSFDAWGKKIEWGNKTRRNILVKIRNVKVYERGDDRKKKRAGKTYYWDLEDCDRVRLEFTAKKGLLRQHCIDKLDDLLRNVKFFEINEGTYRFKSFQGSRILPQIWEGYRTTDKHGNKNFLQLEIRNFRHRVRNINQYLKDVDALEPLKSAIHNAMHKFDDEWRRPMRAYRVYIKVYKNSNRC